MSKLLVLFVFHIYNERVESFIKNCIFKDDNIDFVIVCNNKKIVYDCPDYVKKINRDNIGFDFGGWSHALLYNNLYSSYDNFIFVNSSVIGPFLKTEGIKWTDIYLSGLKDNVKLFGSTINTVSDPEHKSHVQSYIFSMDKLTLEYLIKCNIFSINRNVRNMNEAIWNKEVLMSRKIIENGWNIGSLLPYYQGVDFTFSNKKFKDYKLKNYDDLMFNKYHNVLWNEYELLFVKGNRIQINLFNKNTNTNTNTNVNLPRTIKNKEELMKNPRYLKAMNISSYTKNNGKLPPIIKKVM